MSVAVGVGSRSESRVGSSTLGVADWVEGWVGASAVGMGVEVMAARGVPAPVGVSLDWLVGVDCSVDGLLQPASKQASHIKKIILNLLGGIFYYTALAVLFKAFAHVNPYSSPGSSSKGGSNAWAKIRRTVAGRISSALTFQGIRMGCFPQVGVIAPQDLFHDWGCPQNYLWDSPFFVFTREKSPMLC